MKKSARITSGLFIAVALSAMCGCFPFKKPGGDPFDDSPPEAEYQRADGQPVSYQDEVAPEDDGVDISDFSLSNIDDTVKKAVGLGPDQGLAVQLHRKALNQYKAAAELRSQGKDAKKAFLEAGETFESAAKRWPESALQQDALFMSGESYFFAERYPEANVQYEKLLQNFPNTHHIDKVEAKRFEIARYWLQLEEKDLPNLYFFQVEEDTILFCELYKEDAHEKDFPNSEFEVVKVYDNRKQLLVLELACKGKILQPMEIEADQQRELLRRIQLPEENFVVMDGTLGELTWITPKRSVDN